MASATWLNTPLRLGFVALILASIVKFFLHESAQLSQYAVDWIVGVLYGLSIGLMISGIMKNRRRRPAA